MREFAREKLLAMGKSNKEAWSFLLETGIDEEGRNIIFKGCMETSSSKHVDEYQKLLSLQIMYEHVESTENKKG